MLNVGGTGDALGCGCWKTCHGVSPLRGLRGRSVRPLELAQTSELRGSPRRTQQAHSRSMWGGVGLPESARHSHCLSLQTPVELI